VIAIPIQALAVRSRKDLDERREREEGEHVTLPRRRRLQLATPRRMRFKGFLSVTPEMPVSTDGHGPFLAVDDKNPLYLILLGSPVATGAGAASVTLLSSSRSSPPRQILGELPPSA